MNSRATQALVTACLVLAVTGCRSEENESATTTTAETTKESVRDASVQAVQVTPSISPGIETFLAWLSATGPRLSVLPATGRYEFPAPLGSVGFKTATLQTPKEKDVSVYWAPDSGMHYGYFVRTLVKDPGKILAMSTARGTVTSCPDETTKHGAWSYASGSKVLCLDASRRAYIFQNFGTPGRMEVKAMVFDEGYLRAMWAEPASFGPGLKREMEQAGVPWPFSVR